MVPDLLRAARLVFRPMAPADTRPIFDGYARDPDATRVLT